MASSCPMTASTRKQTPNPTNTASAFNGAIVSTLLQPTDPSLGFSYEITFHTSHPTLVALSAMGKPPLHFHPYQAEYIRVLEGALALSVEGKEKVVTERDGELVVNRWERHRLWAICARDGSRGGGGAVGGFGGNGEESKTRILLSGQNTREAFAVDDVFFQNWYGYQDEVLLGKGGGKGMSLIQILSMFDAGGSYLALPFWVPFGRTLSRAMGILIGRWIGGTLGYQPFYAKWTSDWELACRKMETSLFQRRFARRAKVD